MAKRGGIADSGIFGGIGLGSMVQCDAKDESLFCQFAKLMNVITWLLFLAFLFWIAKSYLFKK
jgi:hypothetical protein